jgi:hypothetical protein
MNVYGMSFADFAQFAATKTIIEGQDRNISEETTFVLDKGADIANVVAGIYGARSDTLKAPVAPGVPTWVIAVAGVVAVVTLVGGIVVTTRKPR